MNRVLALVVISWGSSWPLSGAVAAPPAPNQVAHWPTESVQLQGGREVRGLIESEDDVWVRVIEIRRLPGRPMYLLIRSIDRASIAGVTRLEPDARAELRQRIDRFRNRSRIERGREEAVRLSLVTLGDTHFQQYRGKWFTFQSTVEEAMTRRLIVRVEQVFTAYRQVLPPRVTPSRPLRLVVYGSKDEYRGHLGRLGVDLHNPACFVCEDNLVLAGSELSRHAAQLAAVTAHHDQLRDELKRLEEEFAARLSALARQLQQEGKPKDQIRDLLTAEKAGFERRILAKQRELDSCDRRNEQLFDEATGRMLARLYHEAFHAYLENYVYPHGDYRVPHWLHEGLAMIFEGGLLESETLRVDAPHREALRQLQTELRGDDPLPLDELLTAGPQAFLGPEPVNRYYLYSWGLVYYLAFEKQLLGNPALDQYVRPPSPELSAPRRFEALIQMPLPAFEASWRRSILELQ
ncbi:MAG: DUF1570 domain-containing protein [Pirellulales bacterium]|nr:DUF1570 domain-containing protein [Pirellulales bacterium]